MQVLVVDGHSMIFAWPELRKLHAQRSVSAREWLARRLRSYQDATGTHVVLVFDGRGEKPADDSEPSGIQIFYSSAAQTADDIIERLVAKYASLHQITVATDDHLEQQTVHSFGANSITAETLWNELQSADDEFQRRLHRFRAG